MARMDSYVEYTLELLEPLGPVQARAMFGGWGLYYAGRMMGLIIEDRLYLKTDDTTRPAFEAAGGEPFVYDAGKGRKPVTMSYWTPPADVSDDAHALLPWARRAVEASLRAAQKKPAAKKKSAPAKAKTATPKQTRAKKTVTKKTSRRA
ncbi:TfoX/Sxy family protein [Archangium violaceum]|uniref:Competence protein TfoX n=1 Tax=Archangium violaceum Cb vi76 TaxID=1406225 RepID=A0A084SG03_9BACT|nr:TfoX/Sxy family protein [Archangium violaceum]KFA87388.1 competence protein TfoX [Archangium violaceum Cb vi76]